MSAEQTTAPESEYLTVRLTPELALFVEEQASAMCNSKAGIVKFALTQMKSAQEAANKAAESTAA